MITWKPKTLMGEWWDVVMYEALRQKKLGTSQDAQAQAPQPTAAKRGPKPRWNTLAEGSPALALLRFLDTFQREHGIMPSNRDIAVEHFGDSPKTGYVSIALQSLEHGGWITRQFGVPRGITITKAGLAALIASAA